VFIYIQYELQNRFPWLLPGSSLRAVQCAPTGQIQLTGDKPTEYRKTVYPLRTFHTARTFTGKKVVWELSTIITL